MKKRVCIKDIAREAGMDKSTVSRALKKSPLVKPETQKRIQDLAEAMGYQPDPGLSALAAYKARSKMRTFQANLALIGAGYTPEQFEELFHLAELHRFLKEEATKSGYQIELHCPDTTTKAQRQLSRVLYHRGIRGLIILHSKIPTKEMGFAWKFFSNIMLLKPEHKPFMHCVSVHQQNLMFQALENVHRYGYKQPGLIVPKPTLDTSDQEWPDAFYLASTHFGFPIPKSYFVFDGRKSMKEIGNDFRTWQRKNRIDVAIHVGRGLFKDNIKNFGYSPPRHLGFIATDLDYDDQQTSGLYRSRQQIAKITIDIISGMIQRGEKGRQDSPYSLNVEASWREGNTLQNQ
ncbi:MAG: LacI family DNA-binding transcriptional regulator [Verrucomicrobiota bacterium]